MAKDKLLYVVQKALIEKAGKVLVLKDVWGLDFPGGKLQEGEGKEGDANTLILSLKREVKEETGLGIEVQNPFAVWYYDFPPKHKYYGQSAYLVAFRAKYTSGEFKLSDEHFEFKWVDKNNYKEVDDGSEYFDILEKYFLSEK